MAYEIYGLFHSKEDAIKTADVLGLKGFKNDGIFVFANERMADKLKRRVAAHIESNEVTDHEDHSFINKIKGLFTNKSDSPKDMEEKLRSLGITNKQIEKYLLGIESGDILIVVNSQKRLGNDATDNKFNRHVSHLHPYNVRH